MTIRSQVDLVEIHHSTSPAPKRRHDGREPTDELLHNLTIFLTGFVILEGRVEFHVTKVAVKRDTAVLKVQTARKSIRVG
ncbi:hypothetical protein D3C80_2109120 [compost metagenome]